MFIDFEGIDGSGKTTLSNRLALALRARGHAVVHAREGGELQARVARRLRELTRDPAHLEMSARTEFLLNVARDTQQLEEVVRPALNRGQVCISDRYLYSQLALSAGGRGLSTRTLTPVIHFASGGLLPDLVILVDVDPELARLRKRVAKTMRSARWQMGSRKGQSGLGLAVRVREYFLELAKGDPRRWVVIENSTETLEASLERILAVVLERLEHLGAATLPPPPAQAFAAPLSATALDQAFFALWDVWAEREPGLSVHLLSGLPSLAAHYRRLMHSAKWPSLVARSMDGLRDKASMELRWALADVVPEHVARSLGSDPSPEAMSLREALFDRAKEVVVAGLRGNDSLLAWEFRERALLSDGLRDVLLGLGGLHSSRAWELRAAGLRKGHLAEVGRSLLSVHGEEAEHLRQRLWRLDRVSALRSAYGMSSPFSWSMRESLFANAPKPVLRSLAGLSSPEAHLLREKGAPLSREALDSLDGLDDARAWDLREHYWRQWPAATASSLKALSLGARGEALLDEILGAHGSRLPIVREVYAVRAKARAHQGERASVEEPLHPSH